MRGWKTLKGRHFVIYADPDVSDSFLHSVSDRSEDYYEDITEEFGFRRSNYWTWDERTKIVIFKDHDDYVKMTGLPAWTGGVAHTGQREIYTYSWAEDFLDNLLAHEMTHLIFREFVGYQTRTPPWFDEGMAVYQEKGNKEHYEEMIKKMAESNQLIDLKIFRSLNAGNFSMPMVFYAQSAKMVEYLLTQFNDEYFLKFASKLKDGENFEETLFSVYGFKDIEDFNRDWRSYVSSEN